MVICRWKLGLSLLLLVSAPATLVRAEDGAEAPAAEKEAAAEGAAEADPLVVPEEATNEQLLKQIDTLRALRPTGTNRAEMMESLVKSSNAMVAAADKILSQEPDAAARSAAVKAKFEALGRLGQLGQGDALDKLTVLAKELKDGDDAELAKQASAMLLQLRVRSVMTGNVDDADKLLGEIKEQLAADPNDMNNVRAALGFAQALEYSGKTDALAKTAYKDFSEILSKSTDTNIAEHAKKLEGVVRRLELMGNPIEITGTLLDGTTFDQSTLKGKVVLVDFWATWCGPCIAEMPNVVENYKKYHDKGFEVVGISLDNDRAALEKFIKDRDITWPILFEDKEGDKGWSNPMAGKYGIMGIPTVILVGADGNVVSLKARGPELGRLLAKELGPVDDESAAEEKTEEATK